MTQWTGVPSAPLGARLSQYATLIKVLATSLIRERYLGTWAGALWAFLHPVLLIALFWVVFAQGFKMPTTGERPFLLALIAGIVPWMSFSEAFLGATGAIVSRGYLVRKIAFPLEVLPITHVVAAMIVHVAMLVITFVIYVFYGRTPGWHILWLFYYAAALALFAGGLGLLTSALAVAFRDVQQVLGVLTNIVFWATPIVWTADMLPAGYSWLTDWNPVIFIIEGYRAAFLGDSVPGPSVSNAIAFWGVTIVAWLSGTLVFRRLKPSFAELL